MSGAALVPGQRIGRRLCNHSGGATAHAGNRRHLTAYRLGKGIIMDLLFKLKSVVELYRPLKLVAQQLSHALSKGLVE